MKLRQLLTTAFRVCRSPVAVYMAAAALSRLGSIVLIPLYTRKLSLAEYGDYALAQSLVSLLPTIITFGLLSAIPHAYFSTKDGRDGARRAGGVAAWAAALGLTITAGLVFAVVMRARWGSGGLFQRWELSCVLVAAAGSTLTSIPSIFLRTAQKPFAAATFQLAEFLSVAFGGLVLVGALGRGFRGAIEGLAIAYTLNGLVAGGFIVWHLRGRLEVAGIRGPLRFALPFVPHFLANWVQSVSDRWILRVAGLETSLGGYALAGQLTSPAAMVTAAWHDSASAQMGEVFRERGIGGMASTLRSMQRSYFLATFLPGVAICIAVPILPFFMGAHFAGSTWLIPLILCAMLIDSQYFPTMNIVYYAERTRVIPVITVAAALVNLALNFLLIPQLGIYGALIARGTSGTVRSGAMWFIAKKCLGEAARSQSAIVPKPEPVAAP